MRAKLKRLADIVGATTLLTVASPILMAAMVAIRLDDGGPIFFIQKRAGRRGKAFNLFKLRSMKLNDLSVEGMGQVGAGHPMVSGVGAILRRLRIDELPQLLNVLKGDMSLVGPRPTVPEQVRAYGDWERRRLEVRPGVTGWAQVHGNTELSWQERIALDIWYVDHWSFGVDLKVLARTLGVVLGGERRHEARLKEAISYANGSRRGS